jgi:hypothetical protein
MTSSGKEPPADERKVGYGKPPAHTRFRKGQSGNPGGRPRGMTAGGATALALKEAYRLVTVREGDNVIRLPAIQVILRSQIALAAKGNGPAQRNVIEAVQAIEREIEARVAEAEAKKPMSELEIGRRLAYVFEMIARGEIKVQMPKGAPLLDGLELPERDLAGREFAPSQIASPCGSSKVDENREPQAKTEPGVGTGEEERVPEE